jgi:hypothetical protein
VSLRVTVVGWSVVRSVRNENKVFGESVAEKVGWIVEGMMIVVGETEDVGVD